jgi:hypothetical protein
VVELRIESESRGRIVNGTAPRHVARAMNDIEREVAHYAKDQVDQRFNQVLRTQTPYYRTRIQAVRSSGDWEVNDGGVIYGPWLEGTGSRNSPVTRFKGYRTFRYVAQKVDGNADRIAERVLAPYLREL